MRTSRQLDVIAERAAALRQERGDTEWAPEDRERVDAAFRLLSDVGPAARRYRPEVPA